jgi:hypothetical protein
MSSNGTSLACENNVVINKEDNITSTEESYSFLPQSEQFNPKQAARSKFQQNRRSVRKEKNKDLRREGKPVPKNVPKPKKGLIKPYEEQSLVEHLYPGSIIEQAKAKLIDLKVSDKASQLLDVLETLGLLSFSLPSCDSPMEVAVQLALALKTLIKGSLIENAVSSSQMIEWCKETFGYNVFEPQSGDAETNSSWLSLLPKIKDNWELVRNAPVFEKISNLISMAASIGLCSVTNLSWSVKGIELFRVGSLRKHVSAIDFVGATLDTIIVFIEGGYECFKQRSFAPLLFSSEDGHKFDSLYFTLIELHEHAMVFNLSTKPIEYNGETRPITDLEYGTMLDEAIEMAERAFKSAKGTWQQSVLEKRLTVLRTNRALYAAKRIDGSMRQAPFTIYIWGESGVGKSTVAQVVMADCLRAAGANPDPKFTAIIKESDKYDSTLKSDTAGIFLDDMGNTKSDFMEKSPTERLIDINNNMITYANKADLHEKGKVEVRPKVLVVTSNAPLVQHGRLGSIKPFSIVRRGDVHIRVTVKPKFATDDGRLDSHKAMEEFPESSLVTDIWDLHVYTPDENNKKLMLKPVFGGIETIPVGIDKALNYLTDKCEKHFNIQRLIVDKGQGLVASRQYCSGCNRSSNLCKCEHEKQVNCDFSFEFIRTNMAQMNSVLNNITVRIPECVVNSSITQKLYMMYHYSDFLDLEKQMRRDMSFIFATIMFILCCHGSFTFFYFCSFLIICVGLYVSALAAWRDDMCSRLANNRTITTDLFASLRRSKAVQFFSVCMVGRLLYSCVMFLKSTHKTQSALAPSSVAEILQRDSEVNPWATVEASELHVSDKNRNMTHDQVMARVQKNLFHITLVENNFSQSCDILALGGTLYLLPLHIFKNRKDMKAMITKGDPTKLNSQFKGYVSIAAMKPIKGKDLCIVNIPSGGPMADIKHLFPDEVTVSGSAHLLYRKADGTLNNDILRANYIHNSEAGGAGYHYYAPYNTFTGMCGAILVSAFAKSSIIGIHLRGISGTPSGKALTVTRQEILDTVNECNDWIGTMPSHVNGTFPTTRYEKQVVSTQDIHPKSPINFLEHDKCNVEYLGQTPGRVSHTKSEVIKTPISDLVEEETGVPNKHGPPAFHSWKMWQESLKHSANPGPGVEPTLIDRAVVDYTNGLIEKLQSPDFADWVRDELKPLNEMETLCGVDGKRFIDPMKKGTSKGFPLTGEKREWIYLLNPEDYPDHECPAECDARIMEEFEKMRAMLLRGERCYAIFKACVKDEPTKIGKDKVRVFQAADWAFQMLVRMYFLPIARIFSMFPIDSECAVGVNAMGPEWDILAKHMRKFGEDRILAGDYSKYDLRMPASLIIAAFKVLIRVGEECGQYTSDDIMIMRGICTEIAFSCVAYNGDIIIHRGSNPSGQNLTVYVNCIVNSLLLRCAYYHMYPAEEGNPEPFRRNCAVMTYGDDVKGSVRKGCDWFNHISYADFLARRGMVFTMPDKESEPTPYMNDDDADFLKRHNLFSEDTGFIHGVLDESSIFKSLHTVLKSKSVSAYDQSASNIDGALREWWQYGRDMYEKRRAQMTRVAQRAGISHMCNELERTYDDRLAIFKEKYESA